MLTVYTLGHSTRSIEEFIELLKLQNVECLSDIRTIPKSKYNPQYMQESLTDSLQEAGINYRYLKNLGGLRNKSKQSMNQGWRNLSFRNYADYMQTADFTEGINELMQIAKEKTTAIMCAEAVPWRCHRSLVADALLVRKVRVLDIISKTNIKEHKLTSFASVDGHSVTYPAE